ncbi:hypothetical protein ADK70_38615 [Streptomyces rimosus subsp. pseudoverticillatus]|uniref:GTP-binding protein n=1 Tax=Streptomyces rimosus TaxID=1927 RepID=UPI0006B26A04|nr:GTP-binding protein [Streptomyces rimosus]KOT76387.1 hypothetical protein ADK70_38615 [Streptomyces rimosus subsp. pseudoverticillatus]
MAEREKFDRVKPNVNVMTIGGSDGKTTLTAALTRVCSEAFGGVVVESDEIAAPEARGELVEYNSGNRHYTHGDMPGQTELRDVFLRARQADCAVLVVSAVHGPTPTHGHHVRIARQAGVQSIVVFLNQADLVDDDEVLAQVETEVRDLLSEYEFPGDDAPIITGSARMALGGEGDDALGTSAVKKLVETLDEYVIEPVRAVEEPFLMPVTSVVGTSAGGAQVAGYVERGIVRPGEEVEIVGGGTARTATCADIEMFSKALDEGRAGEYVTLVLDNIPPEEVGQDTVLAAPGSVQARTRFTCAAYLLSPDEGGLHEPFLTGSQVSVLARTAEVTGTCVLADGQDEVRPGGNVQMDITLNVPTCLENGLRLSFTADGRFIGSGVVAGVLA